MKLRSADRQCLPHLPNLAARLISAGFLHFEVGFDDDRKWISTGKLGRMCPVYEVDNIREEEFDGLWKIVLRNSLLGCALDVLRLFLCRVQCYTIRVVRWCHGDAIAPPFFSKILESFVISMRNKSAKK